MRRRRCLIRCAAAAGLAPLLRPAAAAELLRYPRHAGQRDTLGGYAPELLALGLSGSERRYELAELARSPDTLAQGRAMVEMLKPEPPIDVFWTVTTVQRQKALLAADIAQGLERAQANGSFERLFQQHFRETVESLGLQRRRVLELRNPGLPADAPLQRRDWWLDGARSGG